MIITLITDFGIEDGYVGIMKGVMLSINPNLTIVDITHQIPPFDITAAQLVLNSSYRFFPLNTIHLIVVDPGVGTDRKPIMVKSKDYFFIAPDNGVLTPILLKEEKKEIYHLNKPEYFLSKVSSTFHGRDIFAPVAAQLSLGIPYKKIGTIINEAFISPLPSPSVSNFELLGEIIHIDRFGNAISNISKDDFLSFVKEDSFIIEINGIFIDKISSSYLDSKREKPLALFDSFDLLEIAIREGNFSKLFGIEKKQAIKIRVKN